MDFTLSGEARDLATLTRDLAASGRPLWPALAEAGVLAAALPKRAGGEGYGLLEQCAILVELGRAAATAPYLPSIVAASTLARFGADSLVAEWVAPAAAGELVLTAATAGPVDARPEGAGWILDGEVTAVPAADRAALILVPSGPDLFLVRPGDPGVEIEAQRVEGGPGAGVLRLDGAPGHPLEGAAPWLTAHAVVGACAAQLGVVERALELTAEYARTRVQFDRPIGAFQAVAQRLADAYVDVEAIRLTLWQAAWQLDAGLPADAAIATAKFWAADAGHRVAHTAVHVHGGVGLDLDHPLHRYFVAAKRHEFAMGGATAQLRRLGALLAAAQ